VGVRPGAGGAPGEPTRRGEAPHDPSPRDRRIDQSLLRGGLAGIGAVALATLALVVAGAAIAWLLSLIF
jgi:hypothetical protein